MEQLQKMAKITIQLSKWLGKSDKLLDGHEVEFSREFMGSDILIADTKPIDRRRLGEARKQGLKGIVRPGVGFDNVPVDVCALRGIVCAYTPNAPSQAVAELTLGLMLNALRRIHVADAILHHRVINPVGPPWPREMGRSLSGLTVGIVGLGRIGKRLGAILRPLVGKLLACDPYEDATYDEIHGIERVDLDTLCAASDVVSLHVPREPATIDLIARTELTLMPENGIIINTSRGGIVSEQDLCAHLRTHPEFTACLDVFDQEPYRGELRGLGNAILTAHMAAMTLQARERMEREALEAALAILQGEKPRWVIPDEHGADNKSSQR